MVSAAPPPDSVRTSMIIPASKETFFNTKWVPKQSPLCPYDMLYHPPDYNPKSPRSDRQEIQIIRKNIWNQKMVRTVSIHRRLWTTGTPEFHKGISSTAHFMHGRPKWKILDRPTKEYVRVQVKNENPHMRIYNILEWAVLLIEEKNVCTA